jgi:hypothetical protein
MCILPSLQNAAVEAMTEACGVVGNRDVEPFVPTLIGAMLRPTETAEAIHKLGAVTFVQASGVGSGAASGLTLGLRNAGQQATASATSSRRPALDGRHLRTSFFLILDHRNLCIGSMGAGAARNSLFV